MEVNRWILGVGAMLVTGGLSACTTPVDDPTAAGDSEGETDPTEDGGSDVANDDTTPPGDSDAGPGDGTTSGSPDTTTGDDDPSDGDSTDETGTTTGAIDEPGPDLREAGPFAVETSEGTASLPGCSMGYDVYSPSGVADAPAVILAHGFMSNRGSMAGWAEHWASWGVRVIAPDLCHATILDANHEQNGEDLRLLAVDLALGPVIYAGYSAGGLAAVVAASQDDNTVALLGLDMVDSGGTGTGVAGDVDAPAFLVMGEPSTCNESNNGLGVFGGAGGQSLRITSADHCDFQSPADALCGLTCMGGGGGAFDDAAIAAAVRGLSTAIVTWQSDLEPTGVQWWTPGGHYYDEMMADGIVQLP